MIVKSRSEAMDAIYKHISYEFSGNQFFEFLTRLTEWLSSPTASDLHSNLLQFSKIGGFIALYDVCCLVEPEDEDNDPIFIPREFLEGFPFARGDVESSITRTHPQQASSPENSIEQLKTLFARIVRGSPEIRDVQLRSRDFALVIEYFNPDLKDFTSAEIVASTAVAFERVDRIITASFPFEEFAWDIPASLLQAKGKTVTKIDIAPDALVVRFNTGGLHFQTGSDVHDIRIYAGGNQVCYQL